MYAVHFLVNYVNDVFSVHLKISFDLVGGYNIIVVIKALYKHDCSLTIAR
jgi:hypothetical protein